MIRPNPKRFARLLNAAGGVMRTVRGAPGWVDLSQREACWVPLARLRRESRGISNRELRRVLEALEEHGYVERGVDANGRTSYRASAFGLLPIGMG